MRAGLLIRLRVTAASGAVTVVPLPAVIPGENVGGGSGFEQARKPERPDHAAPYPLGERGQVSLGAWPRWQERRRGVAACVVCSRHEDTVTPMGPMATMPGRAAASPRTARVSTAPARTASAKGASAAPAAASRAAKTARPEPASSDTSAGTAASPSITSRPRKRRHSQRRIMVPPDRRCGLSLLHHP